MARIGPRHLWRVALASFCCFVVRSPARAQDRRTVIAITGELTATPLSRAVAQRVGTLLELKNSQFRVIRADSVAWLMDHGIAYAAETPLRPADLREICRQVGASAIVDIMMLHERRKYRGIAFRTVVLRRPSKTVGAEFAMLPVGDATASTADSVALELVPEVVDALRRAPADSLAAFGGGLRCLDFSETGDTTQYHPRVPSNTGCC
jgi:hypothetical protein